MPSNNDQEGSSLTQTQFNEIVHAAALYFEAKLHHECIKPLSSEMRASYIDNYMQCYNVVSNLDKEISSAVSVELLHPVFQPDGFVTIYSEKSAVLRSGNVPINYYCISKGKHFDEIIKHEVRSFCNRLNKLHDTKYTYQETNKNKRLLHYLSSQYTPDKVVKFSMFVPLFILGVYHLYQEQNKMASATYMLLFMMAVIPVAVYDQLKKARFNSQFFMLKNKGYQPQQSKNNDVVFHF